MLKGRIVKERGHFAVDITLECKKGELLALTGPSGSGKTTVIRMLAGLERPDRGTLSSDEAIWYDSDKKINVSARKRKVGYVFQEHTLFPHLNIEKNVYFSCRNTTYVNNLLDMMGIRHLGKRKPHQVSGGERQRAAIAQALASKPTVLLLDEPFSALDTVIRQRLRKQLKKLKRRLGIPIILVTHDNGEAQYLANNIMRLPYSSPLNAQSKPKKELYFPDLSLSFVN